MSKNILKEIQANLLIYDKPSIYLEKIKPSLKNTKLESPSSKRYKMFDIYSNDGKEYFNLNFYTSKYKIEENQFTLLSIKVEENDSLQTLNKKMDMLFIKKEIF